MDQSSELVGRLKGLPRPDVDAYFLLMTLLVATRGTCGRRRVGCVLVDEHNHVLATGYNGVAAGLPHCLDTPCPGRSQPSGHGLHMCEALHAEENALIQCTRPNDIWTVYTTSSPCIHCVRRLMNTGARHILFAERYPHPESEQLWCGYGSKPNGRTWTHRPLTSNLSLSFESTPAAR